MQLWTFVRYTITYLFCSHFSILRSEDLNDGLTLSLVPSCKFHVDTRGMALSMEK